MGAAAREIVPAHLDHLAIYNRKLGPREEDFEKQIVFYHDGKLDNRSPNRTATKASPSEPPPTPAEPEASKNAHFRNLLKIGVAQAAVSFSLYVCEKLSCFFSLDAMEIVKLSVTFN